MQTHVLSSLILFQEPAYCKLSYFEISKICDFVNSLKKRKKKREREKQRKNKNKKKKKKGMGVGEGEPIKMSDALEEHDGKVTVGGRTITNLRFANTLMLSMKKSKNQRPQLEVSTWTRPAQGIKWR